MRYWHGFSYGNPQYYIQLGIPDSKLRGANMGPTWGRQDPGGSYVGPMSIAIWVHIISSHTVLCLKLFDLKDNKLHQNWYNFQNEHLMCSRYNFEARNLPVKKMTYHNLQLNGWLRIVYLLCCLNLVTFIVCSKLVCLCVYVCASMKVCINVKMSVQFILLLSLSFHCQYCGFSSNRITILLCGAYTCNACCCHCDIGC